jgi:bis(5'-nucleosyl)-tetraphosphatase (symmetrical)
VLGNHDLHLLAVAYGVRRNRKADTLNEVLAAPDRDRLLEWLVTRPLAHRHLRSDGNTDLIVHAGVVPQWTLETTVGLAREVESALRRDPHRLFEHMYGDEPDQWSEDLSSNEKLRFTINVLTRLRVCTPEGRIDLKWKGKSPPPNAPYRPWFDIDARATRPARIIFGHWSALGFVQRNGVIGLDSGCVWGGALTAIDLDDDDPTPVTVPCSGYQVPDD